MKDCILSNIWINWRFDGLGDSHKAPELSCISTLEFLRNWWAERLLRFRFVTEQKRGWQGGNVPSNRFCSQRTQRDAVGCCWNVVGSDRSSLLFTILYPAVGSLRLQQSGTFDERDVQLAYKQWVAKKRAQTQWCAWVHTHWHCCTGLLWTGGRWPLGWGKPKLTALSNIGIGHVWSNKQQLRKRWIETIAIQSVCLKLLIR